jgi:hypothetical protein
VIASLTITILVESAVVTAFTIWCRKPLKQLLFSSFCANLFTQSVLWVVLNLYPGAYLATLFVSEICIWGIEAFILYLYRWNQLKLQEAIVLSVIMNLASLAIGWALPV